jgi:hypothetical protein
MNTLYLLMSIFCLRLRDCCCLLLSCFSCSKMKRYLLAYIFYVDLVVCVCELACVDRWHLLPTVRGGGCGGGLGGVEVCCAAVLAELF